MGIQWEIKVSIPISTQQKKLTRAIIRYLQQCRSVIVAHPLEYIQHYHHLLNGRDGDPNQNYVEVPLPLEKNLPKVMKDLLKEKNEEKVQRIADNNWKSMRQGWISPAAK